jgi:hypothetical protein
LRLLRIKTTLHRPTAKLTALTLLLHHLLHPLYLLYIYRRLTTLHRLTTKLTATATATENTCNLRKLTALLLLLVHEILVCSVHLRLTTKLLRGCKLPRHWVEAARVRDCRLHLLTTHRLTTLLWHSTQLLTTKLTRKLTCLLL